MRGCLYNLFYDVFSVASRYSHSFLTSLQSCCSLEQHLCSRVAAIPLPLSSLREARSSMSTCLCLSIPAHSLWTADEYLKKKEICLTMSHWSRTMVSIKMSVQLFKPGKSAKIYSLKVDFNSQLFAWNRFTWVPVWLCQPVVHRKTDFVYYCNAHRSHAIWSDFIVVWNTFYCSLSHQN